MRNVGLTPTIPCELSSLGLVKITLSSLFLRAVSVGEYGDCMGTLLQISSLVVGDLWEL